LLRKYSDKRKQEDYEEMDADTVLQTAVEAEDQWEEELNSFNPASRTTGSAFLLLKALKCKLVFLNLIT